MTYYVYVGNDNFEINDCKAAYETFYWACSCSEEPIALVDGNTGEVLADNEEIIKSFQKNS